jgi:hypothetical protein
MYYSTTGGDNTAIGVSALQNTTSGSRNIGIGITGGEGITTGNYNVVIGSYTGTAAPISATGSNYIVLADGQGNIVASTKTAQTFALQGGTLSSGTGIAFPATQSASTDANTLDDYEEGTWTPTQGAGLTVVGTFSSTGNYTKIGNLVNVLVTLSGSTSIAIASTDAILLTNLPFTTNNRSPGEAINIGHSAGIFTSTSSSTVYSCGTLAATTQIYLSITYRTS